jgi:hypothetical protein
MKLGGAEAAKDNGVTFRAAAAGAAESSLRLQNDFCKTTAWGQG